MSIEDLINIANSLTLNNEILTGAWFIFKKVPAKMYSEELENLIKIQSKILSIGEMLQNISHHWRQPLDLISTLASGIKMGKDFNSLSIEDETEMLDKIIIQTKHLSAIIEDFRSFFKNT